MDAYDWLRILTGMRLQKTANIRSSRDSESLQTITGEMVPGSYESVVLMEDDTVMHIDAAEGLSIEVLRASLGPDPAAVAWGSA